MTGRALTLFCFFGWMLTGCAGKGPEKKAKKDSNIVYVSCDESFRPVIDAQVKVYEASSSATRVVVQYKPEADCLRDLLVDSISIVIATRGFSAGERRLIVDSLRLQPRMVTVARDAVAVIVHPQSADSFFTMAQIREMVGGKAKQNVIPVMDGRKATSTVRFMLDSVLRGGSLGASVSAAASSQEVIDYVSKTPQAVGFIGVSWIGNPEDTAQRSFLQRVRMARLESTDSTNAYVLPVQRVLYTKSYPMVRDLVCVLKEDGQGRGRGFAYFLESQRGQLIFRRAYLMPTILPSYIRQAELKEE
jgi:phosphate transport system substrate-binding protein